MDRESRVSFESLESRTLLSTTLAEPFASAQALPVQPLGDSILQSTLQNASAGDFYQFNSPALGWLTVEMKAETPGMDPALLAYDSLGRPLAYNNNAFLNTHDSRMLMVVAPGQTVYVKAWDLAGIGGQYSLSTSTVVVDSTTPTATVRPAPLSPWQGGRSVDVVKITSDVDGLLMLDTSSWAADSALLPALTVTDAAGTALPTVQGVTPEGKTTISFAAGSGQTYYLHSSATNAATGWWLSLLSRDIQPIQDVAPAQDDPQQDTQDDQGEGDAVDPPFVIEPGDIIAARSRMTAAGLQLVVMGTLGNDVISLSQTATGLVLTTLSGSQSFTGTFAGLAIYGFAGNDVLQTGSTVSLSVEVYGGDGSDSVYASGAGAARLFGQAGDDLLVSIGGGADELTGGDGIDGFWLDNSDTVTDASSVENGFGAVHRISSFIQPWTTDSASSDYVTLEADGRDLKDPVLDPYATKYTDYSDRPLFVDGAQYNDIIQGGLGDCYYLASLAGLAQQDPALVRQVIAPLGDGTYAVRFYRYGREFYYRIDGDLPTNSYGKLVYARLTPQGETWVALMEKAYAHFRYNENTYDSLTGGWMSTVLRELTNKSTDTHWTTSDANRTYTYIQTWLDAGHAVTAGSITNPSSPVVGSHAYMVESVFTVDGVQYIRVYNPWGVDGRGVDSNTRDGLVTMTADVFVANFDGVVCSAA